MKKEKEEIALVYFERNPITLILFIIATIVLDYFAIRLTIDFNPWGILLTAPAFILSFQALWLILNPFALIYENKFEVKKNILNNKVWYFIDLKKTGEINGNKFILTFNDDDTSVVSCTGIKKSHKQKFRDTVNNQVCKSLLERED